MQLMKTIQNNTKLPMCLLACSDLILFGFARLYTVVADLIICFPRSRRLQFAMFSKSSLFTHLWQYSTMSCLLPCTVVFCSIAFAISSSSISSSFLFAAAPAFLFLSLFSFTRFCALLRAAALNFCSEYLSLHSRMSCRLLRFSLQLSPFLPLF